MANNPINLALRFILEIIGLFALAYWGWTQHTGIFRYLWTTGLPITAAAIWGIFRVPNDPGKATVAVPGWLRLILEIAYFSTATWAFYAADQNTWGLIFAITVIIHYVFSYDRILWLLKQ